MQFVYIYRHEYAKHDELRWSIRSVLENYQGPKPPRIMIAGDRPPWYCGPCLDLPPVGRRWHDSNYKLLEACKDIRVEHEFCWMMDDIVFTRSFNDDFLRQPRGYKKDPAYKPEDSEWWVRCKNSLQHFEEPIQYATHLPHVFMKANMLGIADKYDLLSGLHIPENLYGNTWYCNKDVLSHTKVLHYQNEPRDNPDDFNIIVQRPVFVYGNKSWNRHLRKWLADKFPYQSEYESEAPSFRGGLSSRAKELLANRDASKKASIWDCPHRGEVVETAWPKVCPRNKQQEVFSCELHGKCSRREIGVDGVQACNRCSVILEQLGAY